MKLGYLPTMLNQGKIKLSPRCYFADAADLGLTVGAWDSTIKLRSFGGEIELRILSYSMRSATYKSADGQLVLIVEGVTKKIKKSA